MNKNLRDSEQLKRNRRLCKVLSVILVVLMCFSSVFMVVAARTTAWNLQISQVSTDYFVSIGFGGSPNYEWSIIRQRCFLYCKDLIRTYNDYTTNRDINFNLVKELDYCYNNGYSSEAVSIGNRWNTIYYHVIDALNDTKQLVGYGSAALPKINGKEVTVDQYQNLYNTISKQFDELNSIANEIRNLYQMTISGDASNSATGNVFGDSGSVLNFLWNRLGSAIKDIGAGSGNRNSFLGLTISSNSIKTIAESLSGVIKTFAYAIAVILFGVNLTTTALQNEILTLRGGVKVFARVLFVKIWVDLAIPICIYALNIINSLAVQVLNNISTGGKIMNDYHPQMQTNSGNVFDAVIAFLKEILFFFVNLVASIPSTLVIIVMVICIIKVYIKMVARCFELTCLVALSPLFFATLVGEESKRYFRRFISAFLSTAGYIIYVAIVYSVATQWLASIAPPTITDITSFFENMKSLLPRTIILIACCRVMTKPPKVLLSLTDGG